MNDYDVVIVGAGAIGLACAAALSARGDSVLVLERNPSPGQETSSRNSGVIHAGLYYPAGSLKARLCVRGRQLLYARAQREGIPHRKLGKLVVATDPREITRLEALQVRARENGVSGMRWVERAELAQLEPQLRASCALYSSESGIVDAHELMTSYRAEAAAHETTFCMNTDVISVDFVGSHYTISTTHVHTRELQRVSTRRVVNAAGLHASNVAQLAGLPVARLGLVQRLCKGDYFQLAPRVGRHISHLIYPLPVHAGLGVHLTLDIGGQVRAGPDTEYVDTLDYRVQPDKRHSFYDAVRRYFPAVSEADFTADYAGLRPKLQGPDDAFRDFVIEEASPHGLPGMVNLIGIESPGLTASEAIAEYVRDLLAQ